MSFKILICDDDEGILNMLKIMLMYEGYDVIASMESSKVYSLIKKHLPDMMIIDLWMPVMPGYEVIKQIRNNNFKPDIPILAISASIDGRISAMEAGANSFIAKPFDLEHLVSTIDSLLSPD